MMTSQSGRQYAHRFSWTLHFGSIPKGIEVCHSCDTPPCVRPDHLFLGTHAENMADAASKTRMNNTLSTDQVLAIRSAYATGDFSQRDLARRFGTTQTNIGSIVRRETRRLA